MKKRPHHEQIDRNKRSSITRRRSTIARSKSLSNIPESITEAHDRVQSLVKSGGDVSLEELQGAVEYLLDTVKAARSIKG